MVKMFWHLALLKKKKKKDTFKVPHQALGAYDDKSSTSSDILQTKQLLSGQLL